jgi:hypothetical protein
MTIRPPSALAPKPQDDPLAAALDAEIQAEKIATYGRLTKRLEVALARYREAVAEGRAPVDVEPLLAAAGEALWHVVIQRELCGFRNTGLFLRDLEVPAAVRLRMGPAPRER